MLLGAESVIGNLQEYRLCWISGRFSGGKTSMAYRIAYEYLKKGYRCITTNKSVWSDDLQNVHLYGENKILKAVCILDEGGLYFKSSRQVEQIAAYAAKMDCIYIIPSFFPPVRAAQVITIQPVFGFLATGIPLIVYRWRIKLGGFDDSGFFFWWRPSEIYGIYSRQDPGANPDDVVAFLVERMEQFREGYGRENKKFGIRDMATEGGQVNSQNFDILADVAEAFADAADGLKTIPRRRGRRK